MHNNATAVGARNAEFLFTKTIAPACFNLLSERARERQAALMQLKQLLPEELPKLTSSHQLDKVVGSFLDWTRYEYRTLDVKTSDTAKTLASLKELRWLISLANDCFPRLSVLAKLSDILDVSVLVLDNRLGLPVNDILVMLNGCILNRQCYLDAAASSSPSRVHALAAISKRRCSAAEALELNELTKLALSLSLICSERQVDDIAAVVSVFLQTCKTENPLLVSTVACMASFVLDRHEIGNGHVASWLDCLLPIAERSTSSQFLTKFLQLVAALLFKAQLPQIYTQRLAIFLESLLFARTLVCWSDLHPSTFVQSLEDYVQCTHETIPSGLLSGLLLFTVCHRLKVPFACNDRFCLPYGLFLIRFGNSEAVIPSLDGIRPTTQGKFGAEWVDLLRFHTRPLNVTFEHSSFSLVNWWKLKWCLDRSIGPGTDMDTDLVAIERFVENFFVFYKTVPPESMVMDALAKYMKVRFHCLWWTASASRTYEALLNWIESFIIENEAAVKDRLIDSVFFASLLRCILVPFIDIPDSSQLDLSPRSKDRELALFLSRIESRKPPVQASEARDAPPGYSELLSAFLQSTHDALNCIPNPETEPPKTGSAPKRQPRLAAVMLRLFELTLHAFSSKRDPDMRWLDEVDLMPAAEAVAALQALTFAHHTSQFLLHAGLYELLSTLVPFTTRMLRAQSYARDENFRPEDYDLGRSQILQTFSVALNSPSLYRCRCPVFSDGAAAFQLTYQLNTSLFSVFTSRSVNQHEDQYMLNDWRMFLDDLKTSTHPIIPALLGPDSVRSSACLVTRENVNQRLKSTESLDSVVCLPALLNTSGVELQDLTWGCLQTLMLNSLPYETLKCANIEQLDISTKDLTLFAKKHLKHEAENVDFWLCLLNIFARHADDDLPEFLDIAPVELWDAAYCRKELRELLAQSPSSDAQCAKLFEAWLASRKWSDFPLARDEPTQDFLKRSFLLKTMIRQYPSQAKLEQATGIDAGTLTSLVKSAFDELYCFSLFSYLSTDQSCREAGRSIKEHVLQVCLAPEEYNSLLHGSVLHIAAKIIAYPAQQGWPARKHCLKSLSETFKLGAADLSQLLSPFHAAFILPMVLRNQDSAQAVLAVVDVLAGLPSLQSDPQLLSLLASVICSRPGNVLSRMKPQSAAHRELISLLLAAFKARSSASSKARAEAVLSNELDLTASVLNFCHDSVYRQGENIFLCGRAIYSILQANGVDGRGPVAANSCLAAFSHSVREDLNIFLPPKGAETLIEPISEKLEDTLATEDSGSKLKAVASVVIEALMGSVSKASGTHRLLVIVTHIIDCAGFVRACLPALFALLLKEKTMGNEHKQRVMCAIGRELSTKSPIALDLTKALIATLGSFEAGPNFVSRLLQGFDGDPEMIRTLGRSALSAGNWQAAFYLGFIEADLPRNRSGCDLEELGRAFAAGGSAASDYLRAAERRMSQFSFDPVSFEDASQAEPARKLLKTPYWLDCKWLRTADFTLCNRTQPMPLSIFKAECDSVNWLKGLEPADTKTVLSSSDSDQDAIAAHLLSITEDKSQASERALRSVQDLASAASIGPELRALQCVQYIAPKLKVVAAFGVQKIAAQARWASGACEEAFDLGQAALKILDGTAKLASPVASEMKALWLAQLGEWSSVLKAERPSAILRKYIEPAKAFCQGSTTAAPTAKASSLAKIQLTVARFADEQYEQLSQSEDLRLRSKLLQETRAAMEATRTNLARLSTSKTDERRQLERSLHEITSQYNFDQSEYTERLRSRNEFLLNAVKSYVSALALGVQDSKSEMAAVFRLCALWFEHSEQPAVNDEINNHLARGDPKKPGLIVPVRLFLPLIYQLAARASCPDPRSLPPFQKVLLRFLVQLALAHPFACLYQLLALRSASTVCESEPSSAAKRRRLVASSGMPVASSNGADSRAAAAAFVIDHVRKQPGMSEKVEAVEMLCSAYIELASYPLNEHEKQRIDRQSFPPGLKVGRLLYPLEPSLAKLFAQVPVPTASDSSFAGFVEGFNLVGGMNLPKKLQAIGSDGSRHMQLVKGNDDVRQDAVMEQVFSRVNELLASDQETRIRGLSMRTYRVIPLQPLIGLLEWVPQSVPLAHWLAEAHQRLRPSDLKVSQCRELMRSVADQAGATIKAKLDVLQSQIWPKFRPVLRHFFFETFSQSPTVFWNAKAAYTQSLATASIVGWIVGLGDRHCMNILLDQQTGGIVHIDLNLIFEAGKTLRVPELVPFRLTPDCVDGLGPDGLGLEGPFKEHCIATLRLLKRERALLLMVMDVFKYDPLQKWTGLAKAATAAEPDANASLLSGLTDGVSSSASFVTKEASRALLRIKEKLEGREEGAVLSESGHVAYLIQTATDPELLSQMYYGWQPWM